MTSVLLTADWQFQRPTEKERGVVEDVAIGAGSRITLPSACLFRAWLRENRNGLETHDRGGGIEIGKESV